MQRLKLFIVLACAFSGLIALRAADSSSPSLARPPKFSDLFGDDILARGKGVEVRQSHLDQAYVSFRATVSARG